MQSNFNLSDVPTVDPSDLRFVIELLIERGQGLALLHGLDETDIREVEETIWQKIPDANNVRLATALRFRALLDVFASRRLKALFLDRGFRLLAAVAGEAAIRPLNVSFGFNAQRMLLSLDAMTARPKNAIDDLRLPLAA